MSADKYPRIFSRQMEAIVYIMGIIGINRSANLIFYLPKLNVIMAVMKAAIFSTARQKCKV